MTGAGEIDLNLHRQQDLYWRKMVELRVACSYIRSYRYYLGIWLTRLSTLRAIASSSSIAVWAVWKEHALIWGAIIAVSQVADALRDVIPVNKQYKAAAEHTVALDSLFIDAQLEWESIFSGRFTNEQIISRLHKLRKLQRDAESRTFKEGLPQKDDLFRVAEQEARLFFKNTYGVD